MQQLDSSDVHNFRCQIRKYSVDTIVIDLPQNLEPKMARPKEVNLVCPKDA